MGTIRRANQLYIPLQEVLNHSLSPGLGNPVIIDCATTSPEKINLRAELNGELAFHIESTYMGDTHIVLAQKSINCNIYKMR